MIAMNQNDGVETLECNFLAAVRTGGSWVGFWELFCTDLWFNDRLEMMANVLTRRYRLPRQAKEDIKQEALLQFARVLERRPDLGFDSNLGSFKSYISTIIYRCCQKGLRQFKLRYSVSIDEDFTHPVVNTTEQIEQQLDLADSVANLEEPYHQVVSLVCEGRAIDEIAVTIGKSKRTIYRWLEVAKKRLRSHWLSETDDLPNSNS